MSEFRQLSPEDIAAIEAVSHEIYEAIGELVVKFEKLDFALWVVLGVIEGWTSRDYSGRQTKWPQDPSSCGSTPKASGSTSSNSLHH